MLVDISSTKIRPLESMLPGQGGMMLRQEGGVGDVRMLRRGTLYSRILASYNVRRTKIYQYHRVYLIFFLFDGGVSGSDDREKNCSSLAGYLCRAL